MAILYDPLKSEGETDTTSVRNYKTGTQIVDFTNITWIVQNKNYIIRK
jgi:hypothetical protein